MASKKICLNFDILEKREDKITACDVTISSEKPPCDVAKSSGEEEKVSQTPRPEKRKKRKRRDN